MDTLWRIELLGALRAIGDHRSVTRFQTQKTGALLAYLAYYPQRSHPREVLIELLWPESEPRAGRNKLSLALSSLRRQLEPPGVPAGAVILATRAAVQLNPAAVSTDVAQFESILRSAAEVRSGVEQAQRLTEAIELYRGELLLGSCEEWVLPERQRLAEVYFHALDQLIRHLEQAGNLPRALHYARQAVSADPLREEAHQRLIRLLVAAGQPEHALRQYEEVERLLAEEVGAAPTPETHALVQRTRRQRAGTGESTARTFPPEPTPHLATPAFPLAGTITFLLIEIEHEHEREESAGLLRALCESHGGHEIPSASNSLAAAFGCASDALAAALTAQRAAADRLPPEHAGAPRVRMALHTGEARPGAEAQQSSGVEHATRLLLAAHPGHILLSQETAALLERELAPGMQLVDLGLYRLRDQAPPERLFHAHHPEMPRREFPPPNALPAYDGYLPLQLTRFFGREAEIDRLCSMLNSPPASLETQRAQRESVGDDQRFSASLRDLCVTSETSGDSSDPRRSRLVTLTGPGGSGKTRLALEVADRLRTAFHGAVWFVPLQDLTDARLIPDKLLDVLRLPRSPQIEPIEQAVAFLSRQPSLLLLDNFEHLVTEGAALVQTLLEQGPTLTCLVTSRQRLNLAGEQEFPVAPLPVPVANRQYSVASKGTDDPSELATDYWRLATVPSVALFLDRAQAVRPDFQLTRTNATAVAGICARLEGLPLALELAAARAGALAPAQILERLSQRFDLLATTRRGTMPRHRSLRAALDWSYQLLSPDLQRFFVRLSVFQGGWTLEAAETVCEEPQALNYLQQLLECTLVQAAEARGEMRFRLLETLREYGAEQLGSRERGKLRRRHARYYLALAEEADSKIRGPELAAWMARLKAEQDNMRAVLAWAVAHQEAETALRLGGAFFHHWYMESLLAEGRVWLETGLQLPGASSRTAARARALCGLAVMSWLQGDYEAARATIGESVAIYRELDDRVGTATGLGVLGWLEQQTSGNLAAMRAVREESLILFREAGDLWGTANALHDLGRSACEEGDYETAWRLHQESLELFRIQGDPSRLSYPLLGLGHVAQRRGDYATARRYFAESLAIRARYPGESVAKANALANLAAAERCLGNWQAASAALEECIELRRLGSFPQAMAWDLFRLGSIALCAGRLGRAAASLQESLCLFRKHGIRDGEAQALITLARLAHEHGQPAEAAPLLLDGLALAQAASGHATTAAAIEETAALLSHQRAVKDLEQAGRLLGAAAALRDGTAAPVTPYELARHDQQCTAVRNVLGDDVFQSAWAAGRSLTLEQAAAEAMQALEKEAGTRLRNEK